MKCIIVLFILEVLSFKSTLFGQNNYFVYQQEKLTSQLNGIDGYFSLLQDNRLTNDSIREDWSEFDTTKYYNAVVKVDDDRNNLIYVKQFDYPVANLGKLYLYGNEKPSYYIKVNNCSGAGSSTGRIYYFLEIENSELHYLFKEPFLNGLKSEWKVGEQSGYEGKQIYYVCCHPDYQSPDVNNVDFVTDLTVYYHNGNRWLSKTKTIKMFWESDEDFPDLYLFYK
jgi:hypothetical protein